MAESYMVRIVDGDAKLYTTHGDYRRFICRKALKAEIKGENVHVTTRENKEKVFNINSLVFLKKKF